jgi:hypothetical protein
VTVCSPPHLALSVLSQSLLKESERLAAGLKASEAWAESFMSKEDVQDRLQEMR